MKHLLFAASFFLSCTLLTAQPGSPDATFGQNGIARASLPLSPSNNGYSTNLIAELPNGKYIVSVYVSEIGSPNRIRLYFYRFTHNGKVDSTFGSNGRVAVSRSNPNPHLAALTTDAGNRILFTTSDYYDDPQSNFTIARLKENGSPDSTFGNNGVLVLRTTASNQALNKALTVLPDGKILAAGYGEAKGPDRVIKCVLFKLTTKGALDKNFNRTGYTSFSPVATGSGGGADVFTSSRPLALQPDGGILVSYVDIVRFTATGLQDMSFGNNGFVTPQLTNSHTVNFHDLATFSDGSFLVGGSQISFLEDGDGGYATQNIYKYTANGKLDVSFGTGGAITLHNHEYFFGTPAASGDIHVQTGNRFLLIDIPSTNEFFYTDTIRRFLPNGKVDSSFAVNGNIAAPVVNNATLAVSDLLLGADSKIVAARFPFTGSTVGDGNFYLFRYNNNTTLPVAANGTELNHTARVTTTQAGARVVPSVVMFPNPVADKLTISGLQGGKVSRITVYNMQGKAVSETVSSSVQVSLSVAHLPAATYVVVISQNNQTVNRRLFIKK